jgi:hypothetical protein
MLFKLKGCEQLEAISSSSKVLAYSGSQLAA